MRVKAVTHRSPRFLKEAYKLDGIVDLINDERYIPCGDTFIGFDPGNGFTVYVKTLDASVRVRCFDNLMSAVNCARRRK
jgi:hypothetical protein